MEKAQEHLIKERSWFLYWKNHHHGPFSALEIYAWSKQNKNALPSAYVWTSSMDNWVPMEKSPLFQDFQKYSAFYENFSHKTDLPILWKNWNRNSQEDNHPNLSRKLEDNNNFDLNWKHKHQDFNDTALPEYSPEADRIKVKEKLKIKRTKVWWSLAVFIFGCVAIGFIIFLDSQWNRIYQPRGVSDAEFQELLKARESSGELSKNQIAIGLNKNNLTSPQFYVSANLPEKSAILLEIRGVPASLVGSFHFAQQIILKSSKGLIEVPQLPGSEKGLPKGLYQISAKFNNKLLVEKTYFLGGIQDETYQSELNQYHSHLRVQFENELTEGNQILRTLEDQLNTMNDSYELYVLELQNSPSMALMHWMNTRQRWLSYQLQIEAMIKKYKVSTKKQAYFLNSFYINIFELGELFLDGHKKIEDFATAAKVDSKTEVSINFTLAKLKSLVAKNKEQMLALEAKYKNTHQLPWSEVQ